MTSIKSDRLEYLVYGYINDMGNMLICNDIIYMIHMYCSITWILPEYSMKCIAATHLVASRIYQYLNDERNRCEFNHELSKDVLKYIYVRGGAPRDCCLLRKIKDIDVVVDINTLNKKYLHHLKTYHTNSSNMHTSCAFYRHYLNQFEESRRNKIQNRLRHVGTVRAIGRHVPSEFAPDSIATYNFLNVYVPTANKIYNYCARISNCDWVINSRFFFNIWLKSTVKNAITIECRQTNWTLILNKYIYHGIKLENISFDFSDSTGHAYGQLQTLKQLQSSFGLFDTNSVVAEIDAYYNYYAATSRANSYVSNISIPIHPTKMNMLFYDFTINELHISFDSVLRNGEHISDGYFIDFNWERKVRKNNHDNKIINDANVIGVKDINAKILKAPCINVINECTANYYFWRLVKMAQKWITEIETGVWKIDETYLQRTIHHYPLWFDCNFSTGSFTHKFINKFVGWNINHQQDIIDRLRVFRYIKFENRFQKLLVARHVEREGIDVIFYPMIDTDAKIISAPLFKVFNIHKDMSKCFNYAIFREFGKTVQKYINEIENKIWKI
eukprot:517357_1